MELMRITVSEPGLILVNLILLFLLKALSLVLGYFTIRLGYKLVEAGARGEFKFSIGRGDSKIGLQSLSPGLLFVLLGVLLIGYAVYVDKVLTLDSSGSDQPVVLNAAPDVPLPSVKVNAAPDVPLPSVKDLDRR